MVYSVTWFVRFCSDHIKSSLFFLLGKDLFARLRPTASYILSRLFLRCWVKKHVYEQGAESARLFDEERKMYLLLCSYVMHCVHSQCLELHIYYAHASSGKVYTRFPFMTASERALCSPKRLQYDIGEAANMTWKVGLVGNSNKRGNKPGVSRLLLTRAKAK